MKKGLFVDEICFSVNGIEYAIQTQAGKKYKEIVEKKTRRRVANQKQLCRDYGIDVSTDPRIMNTHQAIDELIKRVNSKNDNYISGIKSTGRQTAFTAVRPKDAEHCSIDGVNVSSTDEVLLSEDKTKWPPITNKILTFGGKTYTFKETKLYFDGNNYSDVFAEKNNKTLAETIHEKKYRCFETEARNHYSNFLNKELGLFLKQLKDKGDLFYKRFLNKYGDSVYSQFYINDTSLLEKRGLYIYCVKDELKYIGRSKDPYEKRINNGYGKIHPKNCYLDGQSTNCHLNASITKYKEHIHLLLLPLQDNGMIEKLEKELIHKYIPMWNIQK
ncbi:MAG: hypothetical protein LBL20_02490 [Treponema sp.]|jgi:hypothetical protein|nr:hypothetical protein [Treponema sp.]